MLKGSLSQIDLTEVFRLLASSQQTGLLHIMNTGETVSAGGCYFQLGQVVHATMGRFTGLDALNEICRVTDGTFAFEAGVAAPGQSLAAYPTATLLNMLREQLEEQRALARAMPQPEDVLRYAPGKPLDILEASPDELAALLMCDGTRNVREISLVSGMTPLDLRRALAKFRILGLLELTTPSPSEPEPLSTATPPPPAAPPPSPDQEAPAPTEGRRIVRYWRGKPIYE